MQKVTVLTAKHSNHSRGMIMRTTQKSLDEQRGYYRSDLMRMGFGLAVAGLSYRWVY